MSSCSPIPSVLVNYESSRWTHALGRDAQVRVRSAHGWCEVRVDSRTYGPEYKVTGGNLTRAMKHLRRLEAEHIETMRKA